MRLYVAARSAARLISVVLLLANFEASGFASADQPPSRVVVLSGDLLTIADIGDIAEGASIRVSADGMERIRATRAVVDHYIDQKLPTWPAIPTHSTASIHATSPIP
jgi:hypothetical protein